VREEEELFAVHVTRLSTFPLFVWVSLLAYGAI
jgi:hypothetical protein